MKVYFVLLATAAALTSSAFSMSSKQDQTARNSTEASKEKAAEPGEYDLNMGRKKTPGEKSMSRGTSASGTTTPASTY